jgi:hypothetical protein
VTGLTTAIRKRGEKTVFSSADGPTKGPLFFQWILSCRTIFQQAAAEMEWHSTLRDLEMHNSSKAGFDAQFAAFMKQLPAFDTTPADVGVVVLASLPAPPPPA